MTSSAEVHRAQRWTAREPGPTATGAQRARRRRARESAPRALLFSRNPPVAALAAALAEAGLQGEWTDSGPGAVGEAVAGDLAVCIVNVSRRSERELDYLPCLNQADPLLPVIVINDSDSLGTQRKIRSNKIFYYLLEPLDPDELRDVLRAAVGSGAGRTARAASAVSSFSLSAVRR